MAPSLESFSLGGRQSPSTVPIWVADGFTAPFCPYGGLHSRSTCAFLNTILPRPFSLDLRCRRPSRLRNLLGERIFLVLRALCEPIRWIETRRMGGTLDGSFRSLSPPLINANFVQILSTLDLVWIWSEVRFFVSSRSANC